MIAERKYNPLLCRHPNMPLNLPLIEGSGDTVYDLSENANNGTISNATWTTSEHGWCLEFNALNSEVVIADNSTIDLLNNVTFEALIYPRSEGIQRIAHKSSAFTISTYNTDYRWYLWNFSNSHRSLSDSSMTPDEINHIVITKSESDGVIFYLGAANAGTDTDAKAKVDFSESSVDLILGLDEDGSSYPLDGFIWLFRMYDEVLDEDSIKSSYLDLRRRLRI